MARLRVLLHAVPPPGGDATRRDVRGAAALDRTRRRNGTRGSTGAFPAESPVVAHRVLKLADQHGLLIIEDDIFADFEHTPAPRLAAFDGLERVIHIGSFSKTLSASARCGFLAARPEWIDALTDLKIATSFGGGRLAAELVAEIAHRLGPGR